MYIDTSAVVKLYVEEPDSEACEAIVVGTTLVSSRLLYCEFRSALLGKVSRGVISAELELHGQRDLEPDKDGAFQVGERGRDDGHHHHQRDQAAQQGGVLRAQYLADEDARQEGQDEG